MGLISTYVINMLGYMIVALPIYLLRESFSSK